MENKIIKLVASMFKFEANINSKIGDGMWDSLGQLNLFMALEDEFDIKFEPDEIIKTTSVKDIVKLLESKYSV
jgi:acyl carrier protein